MKLLLLLFLPVMLAAQQYVIPPTTTGNSGKYESKLIPITASRTYTWTWGTQGAVHAVLKARTVFQQDTSGYVVLDSVYSPSGFVAFTVSISGDSLMNVWLPDDAGGLGAPGADLKTRQGWQVKLIVETQSAGNGGKITVAEKSITAYSPPAVSYDDSSRYVKYVDSNRVQHGFVTMSKLYQYVLSQAAGITPAALTDTLDKFNRAVMAGDSATRNAELQKSFARSGGTFDTTIISGRHHNFTYAQRFTQPYLTGSGLYLPIWTKLQDTVAAVWGFALGNYAWTNGPTGATDYIDQVGGWQYNPNQADATQPNFGFSQESKYYVSSAWHSELHQLFNGVGAQLGVRPYTWIGRWNDGRVTSTSINADRTQFGNGGGSNSGTADSTSLDIFAPGWGGPGGLRIQNAYLDFDYGNSLFTIARVQSDTAGTARKPILDWGSAGAGIITLGGAGNPSDGYRVKGAKIAAGTAAVEVSRLTGRVTMSGASVRLPRGPWTSLAADSLEAATQGYVDAKIAGLTFVTSAALTDSLNGVIRPGALTAALSSYATLTALTDTISAKVTRGATIKADTASLAVIADKMYPRTATGGSADTARILPIGGSNKTATGALTLDTLHTPGTYPGTFAGGFISLKNPTSASGANYFSLANTGTVQSITAYNLSITAGGTWDAGSNSVGLKPGANISSNPGSVGDSTCNVGGPTAKGGLHTYGGGLFNGGIGTGGIAPRSGRRLDVLGAAAVSDTLRVGDYTTYTYIIPGGALVQSSTRDIKRNIVPVDTLPLLIERFLSVDPVRYQFRPAIFRTGFDTSNYSPWFTRKAAERQALREEFRTADSLKAEQLAQRQVVGFIAEDLNAAGWSLSAKEIDQSELVAVLWRVVQRVAVKQQRLIDRVDALEARIRALEAR